MLGQGRGRRAVAQVLILIRYMYLVHLKRQSNSGLPLDDSKKLECLILT